MLQEAFRAALRDLEANGASAHLDRHTLHLVESAALGSMAAARPLSAAEWNRCVYRATKLARRWNSAIRRGAPPARLLSELQDDWVALLGELAGSTHACCVSFFTELQSMVTTDDTHPVYLLEQALANPHEAGDLKTRCGSGWRSRAWVVLIMVAELSSLSANEREDLHELFAEHAMAEGDETSWLAEALAEWTEERYGAPF